MSGRRMCDVFTHDVLLPSARVPSRSAVVRKIESRRAKFGDGRRRPNSPDEKVSVHHSSKIHHPNHANGHVLVLPLTTIHHGIMNIICWETYKRERERERDHKVAVSRVVATTLTMMKTTRTVATSSRQTQSSDNLDAMEKNERTALLSPSSSPLTKKPIVATGWGSVFNLVNSAVGSGVLSFPWAYRSAGLGLALLVTVAAFVTTQCTQIILIRSAVQVSAATLAAALFILAVVALRAQGFPPANDITWFHLDDWLDPRISPLNAPPVAILAFQAHIQTVPILYELGPEPNAYSSARDTTGRVRAVRQGQMTIYVGVAGDICLLLYTAMGVCGYLTFGDDLIQSNILDSYNIHADHLAAAARLVVGLVMVVSYPVNQLCAQSAILDVLAELGGQRQGNNDNIACTGDTSRRIVTFTFFTATFIIALLVRDLGLVFDIVGATVGVYVILLLPGALVYNDPTRNVFPFRIFTFVVLVGVGLAICSSTLTMQFMALVQSS
eukprot:scaffold1634_cov137-Amphora_coffeaeformis.AAC.14